MKNDDEQSSLILAVIGIIPVIWFALLVAPYLSSGLMGILEEVPEVMNHPFSIQLCGDSVKTVLACTNQLQYAETFAKCIDGCDWWFRFRKDQIFCKAESDAGEYLFCGA